MDIRGEILDRVRTEPAVFADVFKLMNTGGRISLRPETLLRRLERRSEAARCSVVIADYFRQAGLADADIFETA